MQDALDILVNEGSSLRDELRLRSWGPVEQELAAVLRFLNYRHATGAKALLAGVIGGASSGKSTVFNNLLGGRYASHVTMTSHTTRGVILALPGELREPVDAWVRHDRVLMPALRPQDSEPDDRTQGTPDALTILVLHDEPLNNVLLFDTPDFTTETARREGDLTRRLLAWFDRVIVLVDEERWFDEKTFGALHDELNRYGIPRMILFNCNERPAGFTESDVQQLQARARRMDAEHLVIDYQHGRGFRRFSDETLRPCMDWLMRADAGAARADRRRRVRRLVADNAGHALNEDAQRRAQLRDLRALLTMAIDNEVPAVHEIVREVILAPEQRKLLSTYWRSLGRTADWLRSAPGQFAGRFPLVGRLLMPGKSGTTADGDIEEDAAARGRLFYASEVARLREHLANRAAASSFWRGAGPLDALILRRAAAPDVDGEALSLAQSCSEALSKFEQRVAAEAADLRVNVAGISLGAVIGLFIGGLLALPTGGLSVPAGALLGVAIAAPASGLSARVCLRLYNAVRGTPESRALLEAVDNFREGLRRRAIEAAAQITSAARARTLESKPRLQRALEALRDAEDNLGGHPDSPMEGRRG